MKVYYSRLRIGRACRPLRAVARESVEELRAQFVQRFRNVSTIMDCVSCEKCRLWGKLQVLGLGTALKILLMEGEVLGYGVLQRNEVVALVNTLAQLAKSVDSIRTGSGATSARRTLILPCVVFGVLVLGLCVVVCGLRLVAEEGEGGLVCVILIGSHSAGGVSRARRTLAHFADPVSIPLATSSARRRHAPRGPFRCLRASSRRRGDRRAWRQGPGRALSRNSPRISA